MAATMPREKSRRDIFGTIRLTKMRRNILAFVSIAGLLGFWWLASALGWVNKVLLPPPSDVVTTFVRMATDGSLAKHVAVSLFRVLQGFAIALIVAVPIGILMGSAAVAR